MWPSAVVSALHNQNASCYYSLLLLCARLLSALHGRNESSSPSPMCGQDGMRATNTPRANTCVRYSPWQWERELSRQCAAYKWTRNNRFHVAANAVFQWSVIDLRTVAHCLHAHVHWRKPDELSALPPQPLCSALAFQNTRYWNRVPWHGRTREL